MQLITECLLLDLNFPTRLWFLWKPFTCLLPFCRRTLLVFLFELFYSLWPRICILWSNRDQIVAFLTLLIVWHKLYFFLYFAFLFILVLQSLQLGFSLYVIGPTAWSVYSFPSKCLWCFLVLKHLTLLAHLVLLFKLSTISPPRSWFPSSINPPFLIIFALNISSRLNTLCTEILLLVNFQLFRVGTVVSGLRLSDKIKTIWYCSLS